MLQYDQTDLRTGLQEAKAHLEKFIKQIDDLADAPFVESIASELRGAQGGAQRALKEVGSADDYMRRYDARCSAPKGDRPDYTKFTPEPTQVTRG